MFGSKFFLIFPTRLMKFVTLIGIQLNPKVEQRNVFKIIMLCHKVWTHKLPDYLVDIITKYIPVGNLRSSNKIYLNVSPTTTQAYGLCIGSVFIKESASWPALLNQSTQNPPVLKAVKSFLFCTLVIRSMVWLWVPCPCKGMGKLFICLNVYCVSSYLFVCELHREFP